MKPATPNDLPLEDPPEILHRTSCDVPIPDEDIEALKLGLNPKPHPSNRWFAYWKDDTLSFHCPWSGEFKHRATFRESFGEWRWTEVASVPTESAGWSDDGHVLEIDQLLKRVLSFRSISFPQIALADLRSRARGCLVGLVESDLRCAWMVGPKTEPNSRLTRCLAESMAQRRRFLEQDFLQRFPSWKLPPDLEQLHKIASPSFALLLAPPAAILNWSSALSAAAEADDICFTLGYDREARAACVHLTTVLAALLQGKSVLESLLGEEPGDHTPPALAEIMRGAFMEKPVEALGTTVGPFATLEAACWLLWKHDSFADTVHHAEEMVGYLGKESAQAGVSFDLLPQITATLAGARHGYRSVRFHALVPSMDFDSACPLSRPLADALVEASPEYPDYWLGVG